MADTRKDLVEELERLVPSCGSTKKKLVRAIIEEAKKGEFHDFKSPHEMPKVELVRRLQEASLNLLARRVMDGEFDERPDVEDEAAMSLELKDEPHLRQLLKLPTPGKS